MKGKYLFGLLATFILAAGVVVAQQPAPPPPSPNPAEPFGNNFSIFVEGGGFLGVHAEDITRENMGRYRMNQVRGVGVTQVVTGSPAEKAGLRKDDVILRIDGENITSVRKLNRVVSELAPDHSVRVTVSRGGAEQELTATIGKRNNSSMVGDLFRGGPWTWNRQGNEPRGWKWEGPLINRGDLLDNNDDLAVILGNSRRIGVSTMELTKQLADYFGIANGKGLLVTSVTDDGPAAKAGVRAGDVITAVDGEAVDSPGDISRVINRKKEGDVTLTVIRNKSQQTFRVSPREGGFSTTVGRPQIGRRIVIPRVEIAVPEVDISMPRIVIPAIPSIDIEMPRMRVTPRARIRTVNGPI